MIHNLLFPILFLQIVSCGNEANEKVYKGQNQLYSQPENLEFWQSACNDTSCLSNYMLEQDIEANFNEGQFRLEPDVPFLKSIMKSKNEIAIEISLVSNCQVAFLGDFKLDGDTLDFDYFPKTDSLGRVFTALCWCNYDCSFRVKNLPSKSTDYLVFVKGKPVESLLSLSEVQSKITDALKK